MIPGVVAAQPVIAAGDPHWSNVVLLLQLNDEETAYVDRSSRARTFTSTGTTALDSAYPLFGKPALRFTGFNYLSFADDDDWSFGTGDFTVELWHNQTSNPSGYEGLISHVQTTTSQNGWKIITNNGLYGGMAAQASTSGTANTHSIVSGEAYTLNAWQHLAFVRRGSMLEFFINGASKGQLDIGTSAIFNSDQALRIGRQSMTNLVGRLGNIRITKGVCRYTGPFTPPTAAFPVA